MFRFFVIIFFLISFHLNAQDHILDSLKKALTTAKHDTVKIAILSELEEMCEVEDIPLYAESNIVLCEKGLSARPVGIPQSFYLSHMARALNNIGFLGQVQGNSEKALIYFLKSLTILKKINDKQGIAMALNNIGSVYDKQGDVSKALEYSHQSLKIREEIKDKTGVAQSLNNIGQLYNYQGDNEKALEYYLKSLKIQEEIDEQIGMAYSLNNIGIIYNQQNNIPKALEYYNRSLTIQEKINDKEGMTQSLNNIGNIYINLGEYQKGIDHFLKCLKISEEANLKDRLSYVTNSLASAMMQNGQLKQATEFANRSMSTAKELGYPENIKRSAATLKEIYRKQNLFREALQMYELEIQMQDSINNAETKKIAMRKQFQYQYEKQAAADSVKHTEEQKVKNALLAAQQSQLRQERTQRFALYGGLALVIIFAGFVVSRYRISQKQKAVIQEQKVQVDQAYEKLQEKNKEVTDSIKYARKIQQALITPEKYIDQQLNRLIK
ncbi:MAG: protein serine/threonine phosphatase [Bacteroidetes bacterium]|jgi:tetratricopeptide (TPR) repeat protein|nr:protein serine/threonine phosphatase [Bacteroidota bacterium]